MVADISNPADEFEAFNRHVIELFQAAMEEAKRNGLQRNLSTLEICTVLAMFGMRSAALAIVAADLPIEAFDGQLEEIANEIRAATAAERGLLS